MADIAKIRLGNQSGTYTEYNIKDATARQATDDLDERVDGIEQDIILGGVYDVSAKNSGATFASLSALLSNANLSTLIPTAVRKGGMSVKFVLSSDNKYVQYRLMADEFSTTPSDWQGVDNEPVAGSHNLVESGGVKNVYNSNAININTLIPIGFVPEFQGFINSQGKVGIISGHKHIVYPIKEGDSIYIKANPTKSVIVATLGSYTEPSETTDSYDMIERYFIPLNAESTITADTGSHYLLVVVLNEGEDSTPSKLSINGNDYINGGWNAITLLTNRISTLENGYVFKGIASPSTTIGTPVNKTYYIGGAGVYNNFGDSFEVKEGEIAAFVYESNSWNKTLTKISYCWNVSDNPAFNSVFKELYLVGVQAFNVKSLRLSTPSNNVYTITLYDELNSAIAVYNGINANSDVFISIPSSDRTSIISAVLDHTKLSQVNINRIYLSLNSLVVGNLSANPILCDALTNSNKNVVLPSYTKTTSKRIDTSGTVVAASSNWFYTSPIHLEAGDVLYMLSDGNASASPICLTDSTGSYYTPVVSYGGLHPSTYWWYASSDCYVALSCVDNTYLQLFVAKDSYAKSILDKLNLELSQCKSDIAELQEESANSVDSISIEAINYSFKKPTVIAGADVNTLTSWGTENGATLSLGSKLNNITKLNRKVLTITTPSDNHGIAWYNLPNSVNSEQYALLFEFCINYEGDSVPGPVNIELYSSTTRNSSYKKSLQLQFYGSKVYYRKGWHQACIMFNTAKSFYAVGQNFNPQAVTAVGIHLYNSLNVSYSVSVARIDFVPVMRKPGIVTIVDNFGVSVPAMADYAYSKGVRLNLSIIPGAYVSGTDAPICASRAELDRIAEQGHCIWNHTYEHKRFTDLNYKQINDEINLAEQWMEENGYGKNCDFLSIPSAEFNTESSNAVFDTNVRTIFHNWCYNNQMVYVPWGPVLRTLPVTIIDSVALGEQKTPADIAAVAAKCMTNNALAVIAFHGTYWEIDNGDSWKAYIDAIAAIEGVYHYGIDEIIEGRWC